MYWPEFQKQFFPEMTAPAQKSVLEPVSAPATPVARDRKESIKRRVPVGRPPRLLNTSSRWAKRTGYGKGKKLNVYDGTDLLGQVVVDRALETISYVLPEKSVDISKDAYYRVVAE